MNLRFNIAGSVAGGKQDVLDRAAAIWSPDMQTGNGLQLRAEPENPYDPHAVIILLSTRVRSGLGGVSIYSNEEPAGFVPRRSCPVCLEMLTGKRAGVQSCPSCGAEIAFVHESYPNKIVSKALREGMEVKGSVEWIAKATRNSYWGCRLSIDVSSGGKGT